MSVSLKAVRTILFCFSLGLFCSSLNVFAKISKSPKSQYVTEGRSKIETFANKNDLNSKEWLQFVSDVDKKCDSETDPSQKEEICSFYYEFYTTEDLFKAPSLSESECLTTRNSFDELSNDQKTLGHLKAIVNKICKIK